MRRQASAIKSREFLCYAISYTRKNALKNVCLHILFSSDPEYIEVVEYVVRVQYNVYKRTIDLTFRTIRASFCELCGTKILS